MKPEKIVVNCICNQFDELDLVPNSERGVLVFDSLDGESCFAQQWLNINAFLPGSRVCEARKKPAAASQYTDLFQTGLGHRSAISDHTRRPGAYHFHLARHAV